MHKIHSSCNQSPTPNYSPSQKTHLILKNSVRTNCSIQENINKRKNSRATINTENELLKQIQIQTQQYKELQMKYELSLQEIQKLQMIIERNNSKKNYEKQQLIQEITVLKKQLEQRSRSQIDLHENGILGHIVNEINHKAILHELSEYKEKCKLLTAELETKNLQLDYLTKKLINTQDLINQVQELTTKLSEKDQKIANLEEEHKPYKSKFLLKGVEYFSKKIIDKDCSSSNSNALSTISAIRQNDNSGSYIKL